MAYDAFISYSHAGDGQVAPAVEQGLERLARPWYRLRALSVFRDQTDLPLTDQLWSTIQAKLDDSRFLIVLASPESAASVWVNREITHWCESRGTDHLLLVVTAGDVEWSEKARDYTPGSTAVPEALRGRYREEPLYHDLRWARGVPDLSLHLSRFRGDVAQMASAIHGLPPDELEGEDLRLHRRARRLAKGAVTALLVLALLAATAAVVAVGNARRADRRAREAVARQLGLQALDEPASALDKAFLLSLAAAGLDTGSGTERFRSSRTLIGRYSRLDAMLSTGTPSEATSVRALAFDASGNTLAGTLYAADEGGKVTTAVLRWNGLGGSTHPPPTSTPAPMGQVSFIGETSALAIGGAGDPLTLVSAAQASPSGGAIAAIRPDLSRAVLAEGGSNRLIDLADGQVLAKEPAVAAPAALTSGAAVFATADSLVVLDPATGNEVARAALDRAPSRVIANADGSTVVTITDDAGGPNLQRWSSSAGVVTTSAPPTPIAFDGKVVQAELSPDGERLLVVTDGGTAVLDTTTGAALARDPGAAGLVAADPTGRFVAVGGARLAVWDLSTAQRLIALPEPVNAMAWGGSCSATGACRLATVGSSVDVWEVPILRHVRVAEETNAQAVAISRDGATVATAGWGPVVSLWRLQPRTDDTGREQLAGPGAPTAYDPATGTLARLVGGAVELTPADGPPERAPLDAPGAARLALLAAGTTALVTGAGAPVLVDVRAGTRIALDPLCAGDLTTTSPDGSLVGSFRRADHAIAVCDAHTGQRVAAGRIGTAVDPVEVLAVDDGGTAAVGGGQGIVARYPKEGASYPRGTAIDVRFGGEPVELTALTLTADQLAAGLGARGDEARPGRVLIWDLQPGAEPVVFDVDQRHVAAVALVGGLLAVAGRDAPDGPVTVQVSEASTRRRLGRAFGGLSGDVVQLSGDAAGTSVVGVDGTGQAFRWPVDRDPRREVCAIVGRPLERAEWTAAADGALPRGDYAAQCP